jgi:hypothetical protein
MNTLQTTLRGWLIWLVPLAVLAVLILWQAEWGRGFLREPPTETGIAAKPLIVSLLPEYLPVVTPDVNRDVVERSLFNPTRRPAPVALAQVAKPQLQRGQFALSGTLVVDGKATAFLRETNGGKSRRVAQGETVNGMVVTEIKTDRIRLTLGDESEELALKLAVGPRTTIQPVVASAPGTPGGPITASANPSPGPAPRDVAEVLAERRRVAREAEAAAAAAAAGRPPAGSPTAPVGNVMPAPPVATMSNDPQWQSVYQRYQQPRR